MPNLSSIDERPSHMMSESQIETLYNFLDQYVATYPFSGCILLSQRDYPLISAAYGQANRNFGIPNTLDTRFPIASLSKAFTCAAILLLIQDGKLDLNSSVNKYLPSYAKIDGRISVHHLMSHSSGLPDYRISPGEKLAHIFAAPLSKGEIAGRFLGHPPNWEPGSSFGYCNPGYWLLGLLVEEISRMEFGVFLEERIFRALGMNHSSVDDPSRVIPLRASPYELENQEFVSAPFTDARNFYPQGGLVSTVGDLAIWVKALRQYELLSQEWQDLMFTPNIPANPQGNNHYGYGWHILQKDGKLIYGHGGFHWGYRSHLEHMPEEDSTLIILSNHGFQNLMKVQMPIMDILAGKEITLPQKPNPILTDGEPYLGVYKAGDFEIRLWKDGEQFWMKWGQEVPWEIYPIQEGVFHHVLIDETYPIRKMEDGKLVLAGCEKV